MRYHTSRGRRAFCPLTDHLESLAPVSVLIPGAASASSMIAIGSKESIGRQIQSLTYNHRNTTQLNISKNHILF